MQRDRLLVAEMIEAAERIVALIGKAPGADLAADRDRRDAVLWNFAVLGEAASGISESTRLLRPGLAWRDPVRVRNRIVHGYASVDVDILVAAAQDDVPVLLEGLRSVADELRESDA